MGWLLREQRGPGWKQGWREQTLASMSLPPFPLVAVSVIMLLLLILSSYANYKPKMNRTLINFKVFLFFLPLVLILIARVLSRCERFVFLRIRTKRELVHRAMDFPWGLAVLVVLLLFLNSYQSYFHSFWPPNFWMSDY